jgi:hypothetical protein
MFYGITLGALFLLWGLWAWLRSRRWLLMDRRVWVLVVWTLPALAFYLIIHLRQPGHIFTFLPVLILLVALCISELAKRIAGDRDARPIMAGLAAPLLLFGAGFFLLAPQALFGSQQLPLQSLSRQTIMNHDEVIEERVDYMRDHFDPESTLTVIGGLDYSHLRYYLPQYPSLGELIFLEEGSWALDEQIRTLVLFNDITLEAWQPLEAGFQQVQMKQGSLYYLSWDSSQRLVYDESGFEIEAADENSDGT